MSGGAYDFLYGRVEDAARKLGRRTEPDYRRAFASLLLRVSDALHAVEWVDSGDYSEFDDKEKIMKCISPQDVLNVSVEHAETVMKELEELIKEIKK